MNSSAILLMSCPDQPGIVAAVSAFVREHSGNVIHLEQHVDAEADAFFMRLEWAIDGFAIVRDQIASAFQPIATKFNMSWQLQFSDERPRVAVFVTKESHCLYDLLSRHESGELPMDLPLIISNRTDLQSVADRFNIPFHHFPITKDTKMEQEKREIDLLRAHRIDTIVLARYMQILSPDFVSQFENRVINIHHSFLPAFPGARPYHSAHQRGVKLIGATSHYVTKDLDEGPIIEQDVQRVSHRDTVEDFVRKGKDLEKIVLSRAVRNHVRHRILSFENRTIVFS